MASSNSEMMAFLREQFDGLNGRLDGFEARLTHLEGASESIKVHTEEIDRKVKIKTSRKKQDPLAPYAEGLRGVADVEVHLDADNGRTYIALICEGKDKAPIFRLTAPQLARLVASLEEEGDTEFPADAKNTRQYASCVMDTWTFPLEKLAKVN